MCGKGRHWETHTVSLGCRVLFLTDDGQAELDKLFMDVGGAGGGGRGGESVLVHQMRVAK